MRDPKTIVLLPVRHVVFIEPGTRCLDVKVEQLAMLMAQDRAEARRALQLRPEGSPSMTSSDGEASHAPCAAADAAIGGRGDNAHLQDYNAGSKPEARSLSRGARRKRVRMLAEQRRAEAHTALEGILQEHADAMHMQADEATQHREVAMPSNAEAPGQHEPAVSGSGEPAVQARQPGYAEHRAREERPLGASSEQHQEEWQQEQQQIAAASVMQTEKGQHSASRATCTIKN